MNPQDPQQFDLRSQPPVPSVAAATDPRSQVVERLKGSVNVLVTVSANPSVDQLAAAIGFTLVLNKLKKHGTAVYSGTTPAAIEFLEPAKTIEKNTDSLRDFIVALDKSKADKLRYKVEDKFVKIFITPYHTSLSQNDLEFGQGDFNVDVIIALGVNKREELDQSITAHGRILHDATVVSITNRPGAGDMGSINWHVPEASSFSEILVGLSEQLKSPQTEIFDQQISTAFLTGIVAETERFSNDKTTPQTMSMAAILMKAGANQQLIASKLEVPPPPPPAPPAPAPGPIATQPAAPAADKPPEPAPIPGTFVNPDGSLNISHEEPAPISTEVPEEPVVEEPKVDGIHIDDDGTLLKIDQNDQTPGSSGYLVDQSSGLPNAPMWSHNNTISSAGTVDHDDQTLEEIEKAVNSPHLTTRQEPLDAPGTLPPVTPPPADTSTSSPIASLNAMPVNLDMGHGDAPADPTPPPPPAADPNQPYIPPSDDLSAPPNLPPPVV